MKKQIIIKKEKTKKHRAVLVDFVMSRLDTQIHPQNKSAESSWKVSESPAKVDKEALYACLRGNLVTLKPVVELAHLSTQRWDL